MGDETNVERRWNGIILITSSTYMKMSGGVLTNLVYCSNIGHTFALNTIVNY
jgi:hypothetical protein